MAFTQIIETAASDGQALQDLIAKWDADQRGTAPGYLGARVLREEASGRYLVEVDFSSEEEARRNNDRSETQEWARKLGELTDGEPTYRDLRGIYSSYGGR